VSRPTMGAWCVRFGESALGSRGASFGVAAARRAPSSHASRL
jgi:hypothetical protein